MKNKIVQYPSNILRQKTKDLDLTWLEAHPKGVQIKNETRLLFACKLANGVGIAAQQIGITDSMFVFCGKLAINPKITWKSEETETMTEGCLSLNGEFDVPRSTIILVYYLDRNLNPIETKLEGFEARVFQHEYDHLQGRLICDYGKE